MDRVLFVSSGSSPRGRHGTLTDSLPGERLTRSPFAHTVRLVKSSRTKSEFSATRRAGWGLFVLALFLLGQASAVWHHAFVEHRVCAVDGELAHADGHEHGLGVDSFEAEASDDHGDDPSDDPSDDHGAHDEGEPILVSPSGEEDHDEHCSFPPTRDPRRHPAVEPVLTVQLAPSAIAADVPAEAPLHAGIPVFRLAPKQSPPRRA